MNIEQIKYTIETLVLCDDKISSVIDRTITGDPDYIQLLSTISSFDLKVKVKKGSFSKHSQQFCVYCRGWTLFKELSFDEANAVIRTLQSMEPLFI